MEAGRLPEWNDLPAPPIAIDYWRLAPDAKLIDVMYAIRSDETNHRFVNHTLANLNPKTDVNPVSRAAFSARLQLRSIISCSSLSGNLT
jgi:ubiquinol oxidase